MKYSAGVLCLLLLLFCADSRLTAETFRFAMACDTRGDLKAVRCADNDFGTSPVLGPIIDSIVERNQKDRISLFLFPGDLISGTMKRDAPSVHECNKQQLMKWKEKVAPLLKSEIPIRITAGNHEAISIPEKPVTCGPHGRPYTPDLNNLTTLRDVMSDMVGENSGPASDLGLTYSFDMGPCHFVVLNAYTMFHGNSFSEETIQWLQEDLTKASAAGRKIFVTSHPPAFPGSKHMWDSLPCYDPTYSCSGYDPKYGVDKRRERDRFWNILKQNKVIAYLCGHEHDTQVQEVEGVWHVVSGGGTEKLYYLNGAEGGKETNLALYDGQPQNPRASVNWPWDGNKKSYWGWCLITIDGDKTVLEVVGSDTLPTKASDLKVVKTFTLRDGETGSAK
jgi:hypothetical protein